MIFQYHHLKGHSFSSLSLLAEGKDRSLLFLPRGRRPCWNQPYHWFESSEVRRLKQLTDLSRTWVESIVYAMV